MKIYTIGHSNDPLEFFVGLLQRNGINTLVDVRRVPYSRYAHQFNKKNLAAALASQKIRYVFLGDALGGKITDPSLLDDRGVMDYTKVTRSPRFLKGISHLENLLRENCIIVLMCAEKDPLKCHRFFLISRFLVGKGYEIGHIVDEKIFSHKELEKRIKGRLFGHLDPSPHRG